MNYRLTIPENYRSLLSVKETERAIKLIKDFFQTNLAFELNLVRTTAPLFVESGKGINDDLNGVEQPVAFGVKSVGARVEIVQSLAKWKRLMLADLGFGRYEGLYTDMNAVRPDEMLDNTHSIYVDQWDWEMVIDESDRCIDFLKKIVGTIYDVIRRTEKYICHEYPAVKPVLPETIHFVHSEELEERWPELSPKERERRICQEYGAVFVIGIGGPLRYSDYHEGRAPDYDDWITVTEDGRHGLNGDILVYNPLFDDAYELSSMGIRVDRRSLLRQLELRGCLERRELYFHRRLLNGELPQSIGGGIGQSRLCMFYLRKAHIGEIQASVWPQEMVEKCRSAGIFLL
ncbi:MAG: aspartate--ammonia ligase [candidate division KSB1 bacterium]|nr:aspartate--ammonia ligase [candidate division KSB1 bacterium]